MSIVRSYSAWLAAAAFVFVVAFHGPTWAGPKEPKEPKEPPPSTSEVQAWVFDGAHDAESLYAVALTSAGVQVYIDAGSECSELEPTPGYLLLSPTAVGVYQPAPGTTLQFGPPLDPAVDAAPPSEPIDLDLVTDDCVALEHVDEIATYLAGVDVETAALLSDVEDCADDVEVLACQVLSTAEEVVEFCAPDPEACGAIIFAPPNCSVGDFPSELQWGTGAGCHACSNEIQHASYRVDQIAYAGLMCDYHRSILETDLAALEATLAGEPEGSVLACLAETVETAVNAAAHWLADAQEVAAVLGSLTELCDNESLTESCEDCAGSPPPLPALDVPEVTSGFSAKELGRLHGKFTSAAAKADDDATADRYGDLADRLKDLPDDRVLSVSAPADAPLTQQFVALRDPEIPDDGVSPLAVVLTLVGTEGATLTFGDRLALDAALETFRATIDTTPPCPTCDPPR